MSFLAQLNSDNFGSLEKLDLGTVLPGQPLGKTFCTRSVLFVVIHARQIFDLPSFINIRDINGFPKFETHNPY